MHDPLWALALFFPDIYPWGSIYHGQNQLRKVLDSAVYTYQVDIENITANKSGNPIDSAALMVRYEQDAETATTLFYLKIFQDIIRPFFNKIVIPLVRPIIDPLADVIPDAMKTLIDPWELFERFMNKLIDECLTTVIQC